MVFDGLHDVIKLDLGGPCPAVVDDGLPIGPVPAVHWRERPAASPPVHRSHLASVLMVDTLPGQPCDQP